MFNVRMSYKEGQDIKELEMMVESKDLLKILIEKKFLLENKIYLINFNRAPHNKPVEIAKVIAKVLNRPNTYSYIFVNGKCQNCRNMVKRITYARGDESALLKEVAKYYYLSIKDLKPLYDFCKKSIMIKRMGLNPVNMARESNTDGSILYGKKTEFEL